MQESITQMDEAALGHYFAYGFIPGEWEEYPYVGELEGLKEKLQAELRKYTDYGILVSGGLDSSILVALAKECKAYTIDIEGDGFGLEHVDKLMQQYPFEHKEIRIHPDVLPKMLKKVVATMRFPFADNSSGVLQAAFPQIDRNVLLSGKGGDEFFGNGFITSKLPVELGFLRRLYAGSGKTFCTPFVDLGRFDIPLHLRQGDSKKVLIQEFGKLLPQEIVGKKKASSVVPYHYYLTPDLLDMIKQSPLCSSFIGERNDKMLFRLGVLALWEEKWS